MSDLHKLSQFLGSDNFNNFNLGIELLKSTRDPNLIAQIISSPSYISYRVGFPLIPFFQENPEIWAAVLAKIPKFKADEIIKHLSHRILFLQKCSFESFCGLVNQVVQEYHTDFPLLNEITLEQDFSPCYITHSGNSVVNGKGWTFFRVSREVGPAEVIHEEEWSATAHHPDFTLKFEYFESGGTIPKMWMEKIPMNPEI